MGPPSFEQAPPRPLTCLTLAGEQMRNDQHNAKQYAKQYARGAQPNPVPRCVVLGVYITKGRFWAFWSPRQPCMQRFKQFLLKIPTEQFMAERGGGAQPKFPNRRFLRDHARLWRPWARNRNSIILKSYAFLFANTVIRQSAIAASHLPDLCR